MKATFGAGCFWGVQKAFDKLPVKTVTGYTGGKTRNPNYLLVCTGLTGHTEAVQVDYNSSKVSYENLLKTFFESHDYTIKNKTQYKSVIYYHNETQKEKAEKEILQRNAVTELIKAVTFYPAEEYHQKHY